MWPLFLALTWSVVAASPLFQGATPGSILQEMTTEWQQPTSDGLNIDDYLRTYGYMNDMNKRSDDSAERRADALKLFQSFADLPVTGEADEDTLQHMLGPRCGMKDIQMDRPSNARWNVTEIKYKIRRYTDDISKDNVRSVFVDVLNQWSVPSRLKFKQIKRGRAIMDITFIYGSHRPCRANMDGPGGVIAHAYPPHEHSLAGDIHFDDAETYTYKEGRGLEVTSVALHEAGHALGLGHDRTRGSIMVPWYTGQTTLGPSDIKKMEMLYA